MGDFFQLVQEQPAAFLAVGAAATATYLLYRSRPSPYPSPVPYDCQSLELSGPDKARIAAPRKGQGRGKPAEWAFEDAKTSYESFLRGVRLCPDKPFIGARTGPDNAYEWQTYSEVQTRVNNLGSGLLEEGCEPKDLIGIFSNNRPEWVIAEQAINRHSMVSVPLYDTLGQEAMTYILKQTEMAVCFCEPSKVEVLLKQASEVPSLKVVIKMVSDVTKQEVEQAQKAGIKLLAMTVVEATGAKHHHRESQPSPEDLATVCYTSGTTGNPKGAMLTHRNLVSDYAGIHVIMGTCLDMDNMVHLSYLPLAHIFERVIHIMILQNGGRIGFFRGDVKLLLEDVIALQPTVFPSVPRLLNRIYDKVMDGVNQSSPVKRMLFNLALRMKRQEVEAGIVRNDSIWDRLVFNKIQARLGGKVQVMVTGAAPISNEVLMFLRCAMGCHVLQGYGQTESSAGATLTLPGDGSSGHVGPPLSCNQVKLVSVEELGYFAENNEGEICFKGPNVFVGYLNDKAKTDEAIDEDGWLHSGDIGRWRANGTLAVIDRKKNIFKLAQGEYVAPEKVENIYLQAPLVGQVFLHGISLQPWCVAIIVPDETVMPRWAAEHNITGDMAELCHNEEVRHATLEQIRQIGHEKGLKSFEQAKAIYLHPEPFSVESGVLTPTMKIKRQPMCRYFQRQITAMYTKLQADAK